MSVAAAPPARREPRSPTLGRLLLRTGGRLLVPAAILVAWQVFGGAGMLPHYLSFPSAILEAAVELGGDGELWIHAGHSLFRLLSGFLIGSLLGTLTGLVSGMWRPMRDFVDPVVGFVYPVPKIAFLPVILLIFGLGHGSKIAIVAFSVFFPVFIATLNAVLQIDKHLLWVARNFEAPRTTTLFRVVLPAALPAMFSGLRVGLALSFVVLFAAELIGAKTGLSRLVVEGEEWVRYDIMFVGIFGYAVLGFAADRVLMRIRRVLLRGSLIGTGEASP